MSNTPTHFFVPKHLICTGSLAQWAFSSSNVRSVPLGGFRYVDDCIYCLDAPALLPSGSHAHYSLDEQGHRNYLKRD